MSIDIVRLIEETIPLRKSGTTLKGACPQCGEDKFYVRLRLRFFHCFGCQASGDAISFVMRRDKITYKAAVEALRGME